MKQLTCLFVIILLLIPMTYAFSLENTPLGRWFSKFFNPKPIYQNPLPTKEPIKSELPTQPLSTYSNPDLMEFVKAISNIPSPSSNLRYISQSGNKFEIKYGDGIYKILNNDNWFKINCNDGNSMLPTFDCNDKIILKKPESRNEINVGDIIRYKAGENRYVIHRIIKIANGRYYTRADNWNGIIRYTNGRLDLEDGSIDFENIQDKVIGIIYI